ncbi:putative CRE-TAG-53 protein [Paratrimastix pyriformis]|uniref:CRE-TAG-53 protein n=1 Tax=Paratrimastix pyriformis TaxID=342808 RepID=A0ABQ8UND7_9EUKA|nr:putative CRE-TAG-53 protein [Paratrimastix pyriformis]
MRAFLCALFLTIGLVSALPNMWTLVEQKGVSPSARYGHSWEIKDDTYGVLFGGFGPTADGSLDDLNDLWLFDTVNKNWTVIKAKPGSVVPPPRRWHTCNIVGKTKMYCLGGKNLDGVLADFWYFDFDQMQWFQINDPLPFQPRYGHTVNADCAESRMIMFGGATAAATVNDMWAYSIADNAWIEILTPSRPPARVFHSVVMTACEGMPDPFDIHLTLHGGQLKTGSNSMDVWSFHMSSAIRASWSENSYRPDDVPLRHGHFAFDIGNIMLTWGGSVSDLSTYWYNEDEHTWYSREPFATNHPAQLRFMGAEISFNQIYVFGGYDLLHDSISDELWVYTFDECLFQTDCATCTKRSPTCGWCASKQACLSGDGEPLYESCPVWRSKTCPDDCSSLLTCDDCTASVNCGWCFNTPSYPHPTEACFPGTRDGPIFGDCFEWTKEPEGCPECPRNADCGDCLSSPYCGYCPSQKTCMMGNAHGPANGTCPDWIQDARQCAAPPSCASHTTCDDCAADAHCGFCDDDEVDIRCQSGNSTGPVTGSCRNWNFGKCTPLAQCDTHRTCDKCTADSRCGWCNDLGVARCMDGDKVGPATATCHNWSYETCVSPFPTPIHPGLGAGWIVFIVLMVCAITGGGVAFYFLYWRQRSRRTLSYSTLSASQGSGYGTR